MEIKAGASAEVIITVTADRTADAMGNRGVKVLATPFLVGLLENACHAVVGPHLPPRAGTVGTMVEMRHLAPTPVGMNVRAKATLLVKVALLALYISTPHKALEMLPGQFLGYALLYGSLALMLRFDYGRPFWRSLGWRWPQLPLPAIVAAGMMMAFVIALLGALLKTPETPGPMKELLENAVGAASPWGDVIAPPTFSISFRDEAADSGALLRDLGVDISRLLHGEQEFEIHRQLVPGETYLCRTKVLDVYEKTGRSGPMAFVVRETAVTDRAGEIAVSMRQITVVRL